MNSVTLWVLAFITFVLVLIIQIFDISIFDEQYTICVPSSSPDTRGAIVTNGIPHHIYCKGDFGGEITVSKMYDNGWKLITNIGTDTPVLLFEK